MRSKRCKRKNLLGRSDRKRKVALVSGTSFPKIHPWSWSSFLLFRHVLAAYLYCPVLCCKSTFLCACVCPTGPFIVYMLKDIDILEDWTAIKKVRCWLAAFPCWLSHFCNNTSWSLCSFQAKAASSPLKKKVDSKGMHISLDTH